MSSLWLLKYADFDNFQNVNTHVEAVFENVYAMVYKKNTDMDIKSKMPSVANNKNWMEVIIV